MNKCAVRVSNELLGRLLGLPDGAIVSGVFQDTNDMLADTFSIAVRGAGPQHAEGSYLTYVPLDDLKGKEPDQ